MCLNFIYIYLVTFIEFAEIFKISHKMCKISVLTEMGKQDLRNYIEAILLYTSDTDNK